MIIIKGFRNFERNGQNLEVFMVLANSVRQHIVT